MKRLVQLRIVGVFSLPRILAKSVPYISIFPIYTYIQSLSRGREGGKKREGKKYIKKT